MRAAQRRVINQEAVVLYAEEFCIMNNYCGFLLCFVLCWVLILTDESSGGQKAVKRGETVAGFSAVASAVMKQVLAVEVQEGAVIWKAVCFITLLSRHEGAAHTSSRVKRSAETERGRKSERTNLNVQSREPEGEGGREEGEAISRPLLITFSSLSFSPKPCSQLCIWTH